MFDPNLNPYVTQLELHSDIIQTAPLGIQERRPKIAKGLRPIVVDLGCGAGNFLRDYAQALPDWDFYGFELRYKRLVKGALKFKKWGLTNVQLIQARAEELGNWFLPRSIREIHINFPDPWPKKKQQKHRLLNAGFMKTLHQLLERDGSWVLKTDHPDYFFPTLEQIKAMPFFDVVAYSEDLHGSEYMAGNIATEFELLFRSKGCPVYYVKTRVR